MGEVVEVGSEVKKLKVGDKVVVPFTICCGSVISARTTSGPLCDNTNPNAGSAEAHQWAQRRRTLRLLPHVWRICRRPSPICSRSHGGRRTHPGSRATCRMRNCCSFPTSSPPATKAAENCDIKPGQVVAIWGCGPVGQFAIRSRFHAWSRPRHRHRSLPGASTTRRQRQSPKLLNYEETSRPHRSPQDHDRRTWTRRLHRCRWNGSPRSLTGRLHGRRAKQEA